MSDPPPPLFKSVEDRLTGSLLAPSIYRLQPIPNARGAEIHPELLFRTTFKKFRCNKPYPSAKKGKSKSVNISVPVDDAFVEMIETFKHRLDESAAEDGRFKFMTTDDFVIPLSKDQATNQSYARVQVITDPESSNYASICDSDGTETSLQAVSETSGDACLKIDKVYRFMTDDGKEKVGFTIVLLFYRATGSTEREKKKRKVEYINPLI